jgi:hypothetical protein
MVWQYLNDRRRNMDELYLVIYVAGQSNYGIVVTSGEPTYDSHSVILDSKDKVNYFIKVSNLKSYKIYKLELQKLVEFDKSKPIL